MFGTLLESRATLQTHAGGSFVSIVVHTAIIVGGVMATARQVIDTPMPTRVRNVAFRAPVAPPAPSRVAIVTATSAAVAAAPSPFVLRVPSLVPVGIPPIDLNATATPADFSQGRLASGVCERDCAAGTVSDAGGRSVWSAADVMMRLRDDPVPPRYPEGLRRAGIEGSVVVRFVVDTTGRVEMRSIEVLRSTHEAFTAAVRETLERLRFNPSTNGEHKTRGLAVMPFQFTLR